MGIKRNFAYNSVLTLSQYAIGLITFPYVSRVLGVSNIGIVNYVDHTIDYFVLFSTVGISVIGAREAARYKFDREMLGKVFSSLITLYLFTTSVVLILYVLAVSFIPKFSIYNELFYIGTAKLIFTVFLIEWFYRGIEDFRYITIRSITIKLIYVCSLFILVKERSDYKLYFILTTAAVAANALVNFLFARKFVSFSFKKVLIKPYLGQSFSLGTYFILTSMYTTFNVIFLGWVTNSTQVGYYWAALTIYGIILSFFSAFTGVMLPRMSSLLSQGQGETFKSLINKSFNILFPVCFPLIIGSIMLAPQIIHILSGQEYAGAIIPMQIIMTLVMIVGIAQILAVQVLMPLKEDKMILAASVMGAFIGIVLNIILVKTYGCIGTAIVLLISETSVTSFYIFIVSKKNIIDFPWRSLFTNLAYSIPYILICYSTILLFSNAVLILSVSILSSLIYMVVINIYFLKNVEFLVIIHSVRNLITFR